MSAAAGRDASAARRYQQMVAAAVADAPKLTDAQRARLREIFAPALNSPAVTP